MENKLTLVTGGARSGKSDYALRLVEGEQNVLFVATAQPFDDDMRQRIANHQLERPPMWDTLEAPQQVGQALCQLGRSKSRTVIIDCLTMLTSNVILALGDEVESEAAEHAVKIELSRLLEAHQQIGGHMIIVTNEVGLGVVPAYKLGRIYRDALGRANQQVAAVADQVIFMVAGLPMIVKRL